MGEVVPIVGDVLTGGALSRRRAERAARRAQEAQERELERVRAQANRPQAFRGQRGGSGTRAKGGTILTSMDGGTLGGGGSELPTRRPTLLGQ